MDILTDPGLRLSLGGVVVAIVVVCLGIYYLSCSKQHQKRTSTDKQNPPPGNEVQNLAPSEDDESEIQSYVGDFEFQIGQLLCQNDVGFAIVVGMTAAGGADLDATKMVTAFAKCENGLGFSVLPKTNLSRAELRALIKSAAKFPYNRKAYPYLKVICFYFAGHGGGDTKTKQPFIEAKYGTTLYVQEIVKQFYPINTPNMPVDIQRLFFFDMCLGPNNDCGVTLRTSGIATRNLPAIDAVPAQGNCLVAFATSFDYTSGGDKEGGGFWTRFLHQNITKDQDIFKTLADTWKDTVDFTNKLAQDLQTPEIQGPSLTACMGPLNLHQLKVQAQAVQQQVRYPGPPQQVTRRNVATDGDLRDTDPILTKEPILRHLTNWLASVTAEWRDIGRSLNVDNTYLESFYRDRGLSDADRLANTLDVWERTDCSPHTFKQLISSLKDKRYKKAVKTVKKNLQDEEIRREYLP